MYVSLLVSVVDNLFACPPIEAEIKYMSGWYVDTIVAQTISLFDNSVPSSVNMSHSCFCSSLDVLVLTLHECLEYIILGSQPVRSAHVFGSLILARFSLSTSLHKIVWLSQLVL